MNNETLQRLANFTLKHSTIHVNNAILVGIDQLRVGMYIQLDVSWLDHPFPRSHFRITHAEQIATLRTCGIAQVYCIPQESDASSLAALDVVRATSVLDQPDSPVKPAKVQVAPANLSEVAQQNEILARCDASFSSAMKAYQDMADFALAQAAYAKRYADQAVVSVISDLKHHEQSVIRLLSEMSGDRRALHSVNVMVISMLLGKSLGLTEQELQDTGQAAIVHDLGKLQLSAHQRENIPGMSPADYAGYVSHVLLSVKIAQEMGLSDLAVDIVAEHHEMADGSGFPNRLRSQDMSRAAQIVALVNRYDSLCYPAHGKLAVTPHDALTVLFSQLKPHFDPVILGAFIRMMGVYPPGSVVQLADQRYALVISVNSSRPLRPKVLLYAPSVPIEQAIYFDLEQAPSVCIKKCFRPAQVPREVLDYLSPRRRICYYFERAVEVRHSNDELSNNGSLPEAP